MMSLNEAAEQHIAFENGTNGDIFVQKSPTAIIETLANALISIYNYHQK